MKKVQITIILLAIGLLLPFSSDAQTVAGDLKGLRGVLEQLYDEMIVLCSQIIGVAQGIAGFGATFYIGSRVWKHIANAEPVDFYPLFRPFVLGFCIMIFPAVLGVINGVLKPTVNATGAMVEDSNKTIERLAKLREIAMMKSESWQMYVGDTGFGNQDLWYRYTHDDADPGGQSFLESIGNDIKFQMSKLSYQLRFLIKRVFSEILQMLFEAAALCIDTIRTFQLVVLAILGPLVFGLAVFDGFEFTLTSWLARYINIYLWLPVANIFGSIIGKIQEKMITMDIAEIEATGDSVFNQTDFAYIIFMIIGIVGYFTVPSVANYIVQAGPNALTQKVTGLAGKANPIR